MHKWSALGYNYMHDVNLPQATYYQKTAVCLMTVNVVFISKVFIFKIKGNSSHGSWLCPLASLVTLTFGKLTGTNLTAFTCILKTKTEETYRMDVAIHRSCRFSYLGNTLRPNLRVLTGRNATKALHSVEHICKNGLCVEFAWLQFLQAKSLFHCLISRWDQVYKKCRMNQW